MITLTNEIISMNRHFAAGVRLDDEALALDVIDEVGPGGEFLSHEHTLSQWKSLWVPQLFDRSQLEAWQEAGAKGLNERLREATIALMDEHQVEPLSDAAEAEIERILQRKK
jgi:trimethylamine--corrinoid protein Co-methyltransferase